jgi:hypothetical protein
VGLGDPNDRDQSEIAVVYACKMPTPVGSSEGGCRAARRLGSEGGGDRLVEGHTPEHLEVLEEIERHGLPGLVKMLREEGLEEVRFVLWDLAGWHKDYALALGSGATQEQKRRGWEMFVHTEKILVTALHEVLRQQVEETMNVLSDGPEGLYG